jgi:hypothetical protein
MDSVVAMVYCIKTRAVKTRLLKVMCKEAGARYETLVLHTIIRWLFKGKVLSRFYELRNELLEIFVTEKSEFAALIKDETWCSKVAYLVDIFEHLNILNASMQGKEQNLFTSRDKLHGFLRKIKIKKAKVEKSDLEMFPLSADTDPEITSCLIFQHLGFGG